MGQLTFIGDRLMTGIGPIVEVVMTSGELKPAS